MLGSFLKKRSAGIRDLRHGSLVDEDWRGRDPEALRAVACQEVPLLPWVTHFFVSATVTRDPNHPLGRLLGDILVLKPSASGQGKARRIPFREEHGHHVGGTHHLALLNHPEVYERLREWLATSPVSARDSPPEACGRTLQRAVVVLPRVRPRGGFSGWHGHRAGIASQPTGENREVEPAKRSRVRPIGFREARDGTEVPKVVKPMPETKTQRRPPAKKKAAAPTRRASHRARDAGKAVDRSRELSEDVLKSLDDGAETAIEAVRKFVDTVDKALPPRGEGPSRREEITDSALEMAQRLAHTQYEFLRKVVDSAGKTLTRSDNAK